MYEKLEKMLLAYLQSDISLELDGKKYRHGKFVNFKMYDIYIRLELLVNDKSKRRIDLPIPFKITDNEDHLTFSYLLSDMGDFWEDVYDYIYENVDYEKNKLYDKQLIIRKEK